MHALNAFINNIREIVNVNVKGINYYMVRIILLDHNDDSICTKQIKKSFKNIL